MLFFVKSRHLDLTLQNANAYHRYSEFESFRNAMTKLYPTLIIPPIPSKQTIGDYAVKQGKAKEDVAMIARRKRMLQTFLNRIARHPILSNEHVFHRFLEGEVSWVRCFVPLIQFLSPKSPAQIITGSPWSDKAQTSVSGPICYAPQIGGKETSFANEEPCFTTS